MINETALEHSNNRQTEKAFAITADLYDQGFPSAVSGGCARRYMGWCRWMNDADMLTTADDATVEKTLKQYGLQILAIHEHMVAGMDEDGLYEVCLWKGQGTNTSVFAKHSLNWRFEHRALAIDPYTRRPIEQPGGVQNLTDVKARFDQEALLRYDPYICYNALSFACREDIPFDETMMELMRKQPRANFFAGLFFKIIAKVLIGRNPSKGMDRLLEANLFYHLPDISKAWSSASEETRETLDSCSDWIQPWLLLVKMHPKVKIDMLRIYFPERWIVYYENRDTIFFPLLDNSTRQKDSWTYWHIRKMMRDIALPPKHIQDSAPITNRTTPWPFP